MTEAIHVTLEPNEHNKDGCALTVYFSEGTTTEQAEEWVRQADPNSAPLWVDLDDDLFGASKCGTQPFKGVVRFQYHPTG